MRARVLILAAILVCAVVGRGAYAVYLVHHDEIVTESGDTPTYLGPARELAEHGRFDRPDGSESRHPEFIRTPGYPVFIAAVYRVFGVGDITAVLLAQIVVSGFTILLAYLLATRMWSSSVGLIAALFTALEPLQNSTSATLLTETLSTFVLLAAALVGYEALRDDTPRPGLWALLGFILAVATLIRPVSYYLPAFVLILLVTRYLRRTDAARAIVQVAAAFLVPIVVLVGGWQVRNHERVDSWRISGVEARNLYLYRAAGVVAERSGLSFDEAQDRLREQFGHRGTEREGPYYDRMYDEAMRILRDDPVQVLEDALRGLWSELFGVRSKFFGYLGVHPVPDAVAALARAGLLVFYAACAYGIALVIRARRHRFAHAFVLGVAAYVLLGSAGPEAFGGRGERFRAPIMPILILYAAFGVYSGWQWLERERSRRRVTQASSG
jgi:4-amino-4-deoxy-L-arabinose transferase-like glycosyltransferase